MNKMASKTNGFIDLRERFRSKKKMKSFPNKQAMDLLIDSNSVPKSKSVKEKSEPKHSRLRSYGRSSSSISVEIVVHNAVLREDTGTLGRALSDDSLQINAMNTAGYTALHQACIIGSLSCTKMLLTAGADLFMKSTEGDTALQLAVLCGHFEVAEYLISMGAKDSEIRDGVQASRLHKGVSWCL